MKIILPGNNDNRARSVALPFIRGIFLPWQHDFIAFHPIFLLLILR